MLLNKDLAAKSLKNQALMTESRKGKCFRRISALLLFAFSSEAFHINDDRKNSD